MKADVHPDPRVLPRADALRPSRRRSGWRSASVLSRTSVAVSLGLHGAAAILLVAWGLGARPAASGGTVSLEFAMEQLVEAAEEECRTPDAIEMPPVPDLPESDPERPVAEPLPEVLLFEAEDELEPLEPPREALEVPLRVVGRPARRPQPPREPPPAAPPRKAPPRPASVASTARRTAPTPEGPIQALVTPIHYPPEAQRQGVYGVVWVTLTITQDGRVVDAVLAQSSGSSLLDDAALDSVRRWRFARLPRERRAMVPIEFVLGGLATVR